MFLSSCRKGIFILERCIKAFQDRKITLCTVINCPDFLAHLEKGHNKVFRGSMENVCAHGASPQPASSRAAPSVHSEDEHLFPNCLIHGFF